jgi:hypothetical protein
MKAGRLIVIGLLLATATAGRAEAATNETAAAVKPLANEMDVIALVNRAMLSLGTNGVGGVLQTLGPYWHVSKTQMDTMLADSEQKRDKAAQDYGAFVGFEPLKVKRLGRCLLLVVMLEKTEKKAIVWYFAFYQPKDSWVVSSCYWEPGFERMLLYNN